VARRRDLLKLVSTYVPLRVSREREFEDLDISQHGEALHCIPHVFPI
jgi:ammonia channel protein AmtB